jgi:hypothetical protein
MRYLKTYKVFESQDLISEIKDCFLSVNDITGVKVDSNSDGLVSVSIGLSQRITPDESGISKFDVKYKELINGNDIAEEIANSISISMGMGFRVIRAEVSWDNAGEWKLANNDKEGSGP